MAFCDYCELDVVVVDGAVLAGCCGCEVDSVELVLLAGAVLDVAAGVEELEEVVVLVRYVLLLL